MWWVYVLHCEDDSFYTGITTDPQRRYAEHRAGKGARYTRSHPVNALVYLEPQADRSAASKREYQIKQLSRDAKEALIASPRNGLEAYQREPSEK